MILRHDGHVAFQQRLAAGRHFREKSHVTRFVKSGTPGALANRPAAQNRHLLAALRPLSVHARARQYWVERRSVAIARDMALSLS